MHARLKGALTTAALLAMLLPMGSRWTPVRRDVFCRPATVLAASALGAGWRVEPGGDGFRIEVAPMPIRVALNCSGIRFFTITFALLAGLAVECRRYGALALALPAAFLLTVAANAARIVSGWWVRGLAGGVFAETGLGYLHLSVGALCFVVFLVGGYSLWERSLRHVHTPAVAE